MQSAIQKWVIFFLLLIINDNGAIFMGKKNGMVNKVEQFYHISEIKKIFYQS